MTNARRIRSFLYLMTPLLAGVTLLNLNTKVRRAQGERLAPSQRSQYPRVSGGNAPKLSDAAASAMKRLRSGDIEGVKRLVLSGVDPNALTNQGNTLFDAAAECGDVELVKWLLAHGADAGKVDGNGLTPLISTMLGWQVNLKDYKEAAVYPAELSPSRRGASSSGGGTRRFVAPVSLRKHGAKAFFECLDLLIAQGANIDARDIEGRTPLYYAASDLDMFLFFLNKGASLHIPGADINTSIFFRAGAEGRRPVVAKLLSSLAESTAEERDYLLGGALRSRRKELAQLLLAKGCGKGDISHTLFFTTEARYGEGLRLLKQAGANVPDRDLRQALEYAVRDGAIADAKALLEAGATPNYIGSRGFTPLTLAISLSDADMAELLIKHGADIGMRDSMDNTPAMLVTRKSDRLKSLVSVHTK